jgi:hypothetical protein
MGREFWIIQQCARLRTVSNFLYFDVIIVIVARLVGSKLQNSSAMMSVW